jgi:hypothetical protein
MISRSFVVLRAPSTAPLTGSESSIGRQAAATNTLSAALFLCCPAKARRFYYGDILSPGVTTRYESALEKSGKYAHG